MEAQACLNMVVELHNKYKCYVSKICADDDASTRSMLKWSNDDYMRINNTTVYPTSVITKGPNKGKLQKRANNRRLPPQIPEPFFVANPNHRKKVLTGELLALAAFPVSNKCGMTKMDANRIGKNFAYMICQLPRLREEQYLLAGKAVLDHHFDCHDFCGPQCQQKQLSEVSCELGNNKRFHCSKKDDALHYTKLEQIVE